MFDDMTYEMFTSGDCWVLASVLHHQTGWKYVFAMNAVGSREYGWGHAAVLTPSGAILDIEGVHQDHDAWLRNWNANGEVLITDEPIDFNLLEPLWSDEFLSSEIAAYDIADDLIALAE